MSPLPHIVLRVAVCGDVVGMYGGQQERGQKYAFFDGEVEVGTGTLVAEVVDFILVPQPHQGKGYGQRILEALVAMGGRTALAVTPAGERLLRRAGWHNRFRPKGQWDVKPYVGVKYVTRRAGGGLA